MTNLKIINATPGPTTQEEILELIKNYPMGITIREISMILNRPVSMIQICIKRLVLEKKIYGHKKNNNMTLIYYPKNN